MSQEPPSRSTSGGPGAAAPPVPASRRATITDVAAAAQVSIATVSRCLNGTGRVLPATRERVQRIADDLGYAPSRTAQGLVTGRTSTIGVVLPDVTNPFFAPLLAALESTAQERDHGMLIADSREDPEAEIRLARRMAAQADGIVLVSSRLPDAEIRTLAEQLPVVLANREAEGIDCAVIDVAPGLTGAVEHLASLGHTRVAFLAGPDGSWSGRAKEAALTETARRLGIALAVRGPNRPTFVAGREATDAVLAEGFSAVICYDDLMALGVLSRCADLGVNVPADLSVVGCDDALPEGMARPALTTVEGRSEDLGRFSAELLLSRMTDPAASPQARSVTSRLVVRDSTSRCAG